MQKTRTFSQVYADIKANRNQCKEGSNGSKMSTYHELNVVIL